MRAKKRELSDKLADRACIALVAGYLIACLVDEIEAGAGTVFFIWGALYAGVCAYRSIKILTHKTNKK